MHWWLSNLCGSGELLRGFTCFWKPHCDYSCFSGGALVHTLPHFDPTLPLFPVFRKLITLSDIFEVKISRLDQRSEVPPPIAPTTPDCWGARGYRVL